MVSLLGGFDVLKSKKLSQKTLTSKRRRKSHQKKGRGKTKKFKKQKKAKKAKKEKKQKTH